MVDVPKWTHCTVKITFKMPLQVELITPVTRYYYGAMLLREGRLFADLRVVMSWGAVIRCAVKGPRNVAFIEK